MLHAEYQACERAFTLASGTMYVDYVNVTKIVLLFREYFVFKRKPLVCFGYVGRVVMAATFTATVSAEVTAIAASTYPVSVPVAGRWAVAVTATIPGSSLL